LEFIAKLVYLFLDLSNIVGRVFLH